MKLYDKINYIILKDIIIYDIFCRDGVLFILADDIYTNIVVKINNHILSIDTISSSYNNVSIIKYNLPDDLQSESILLDIEYNNFLYKNITLIHNKNKKNNNDLKIYSSVYFTDDAGKYVLDAWAKHQFHVGVDKIFMYYESCDTRNFINQQENMQLIFWDFTSNLPTNIRHQRLGKNQTASMMHCLYKYAKAEADWMMSLDLDEFILPISSKNIKDIIQKLQPISHIQMRGKVARFKYDQNICTHPCMDEKHTDYNKLIKSTPFSDKEPIPESNRKYLHKSSESDMVNIHILNNIKNDLYYDEHITFLHLYNFSRFIGRAKWEPGENFIQDKDWNTLYNILN
jgi:hypothetical protein